MTPPEHTFSASPALAKRNRLSMRQFTMREKVERIPQTTWDLLAKKGGECPGGLDWWTNHPDGSFTCDYCGKPVKVKNAKWYASRGEMVLHPATREEVEAHVGIA